MRSVFFFTTIFYYVFNDDIKERYFCGPYSPQERVPFHFYKQLFYCPVVDTNFLTYLIWFWGVTISDNLQKIYYLIRGYFKALENSIGDYTEGLVTRAADVLVGIFRGMIGKHAGTVCTTGTDRPSHFFQCLYCSSHPSTNLLMISIIHTSIYCNVTNEVQKKIKNNLWKGTKQKPWVNQGLL